jgi:type VI secretion system secreted protein VgrG
VTATGTPVVTWTIVPATGNEVPPGMSLSSDGSLSGVPTTPGTYTVTVQASNGVTFDEKTYAVTVN